MGYFGRFLIGLLIAGLLVISGCSTPITLIYPQPEKGPDVYLISYSADGDRKYLETKIQEVSTKVCSDYIFIEEVFYGLDKERLATDFVYRLEWLIRCP